MKIKKLKSQQTSALSKAVTNVKQIIKKKNKDSAKKVIKDESKTLELQKGKPKIKEILIIKPKQEKLVSVKQKKIENEIFETNEIQQKNENKKLKKSKPVVSKEEKAYKSTRGIVYVGHIPYGFFEDEMKEYFEQFGTVTRVRVARSKKTGKSRGYGYIEFKSPEVAKIAADTMNNYLMCGRLLKTTYIPPEKQHWGYFAHRRWTVKKYPKLLNRKQELKKNENPISDLNYTKSVRRSLRQISALEEKLKSSGINIKFKLADVP